MIGSSDNTNSIVRSYCLNDKRIRIISKTNGGSASARNLGIKNAKGQYISFVDADDYIHKDYLKILYDTIQKYNVDIVECNFWVTNMYSDELNVIQEENNNVQILDNIEKLKELCAKETYLKSVVLWNKLYKKELFENESFIEKKGVDDEYIIYKIFFKAKEIAVIDNKLYCYFLSENSQMRSKPNLKRLDNIEAIENQMIFFDKQGLSNLKEMLYYRYYRCIIEDICFLRKYFPREKDRIEMLIQKRKNIFKVFFSKYVSIKEKVYLAIFLIMPKYAISIHNYIAKSKKYKN